MSVYKPKGSPFYQYDFQLGGDGFSGSTKRTNGRDAWAVDKAEREKAKRAQAAARAAAASLKINDVAGRYWREVGQHHAGKANTWRDLERLVDYFGPETLLTEIDDNAVATLLAGRRGHRVTRTTKKPPPKGAPPLPLISNATVNRSTTEVLKKLFTRAKPRASDSTTSRTGKCTGWPSRRSACASWSATRPIASRRRRGTITGPSSPSPGRADSGSRNAC